MKRLEDLPEFEPPPDMEYRSLGTSGMSVSSVGFGTWSIGGIKWGALDADTALNALHRALDKGINLFDTSSVYGRGRSEKLLGRVASERRDEMIIAGKGGVRVDADGKLYTDTRPAALQTDIDQSRERLRTETIDLYQLQWPPENGLSPGSLDKLEEFLDKGVVRALGVCHFPASYLEKIQEHLQLDCVQYRFNLLEPDRFERERKYCVDQNIDILACTPLAKGLLTGKHGAIPDFYDHDNRRGDLLFEPDRFQYHLDTVNALMEVSEEIKKPASGIALNWVHNQPGIKAALAGMKTAEQVDQNIYGAGWELPENFDEQLDR